MPRRLLVPLVLLTCLCAAAVAGQGRVAASPAVVPHPPRAFFGITPQTSLDDTALAEMRTGGVGALRVFVGWGGLEPRRGVYDWSSLDAFMAQVDGKGFRILPFICSTPAWISPAFNHLPVHDHAERSAWKQFLAAIVRRYGSGGRFWERNPQLKPEPIKTWQIWNEENASNFAQASVSQYATLLEDSAHVIRHLDPSAKIMLGGLYATPVKKPPKARSAVDFLSRLYEIPGIARDFDVVALHPYAPSPSKMERDIVGLRAVMAENGDGRKPLQITEFGWGSQGSGGTPIEPGISRQATDMRKAYWILLAGRLVWHLQAAYWFTWEDRAASPGLCSFCDSTGFVSADGDPKPAWLQFEAIAAGAAPTESSGRG